MREREAITVATDARRDGDRVRLALRVTLPEGVHVEPHEPPEPFLIPTVVGIDGDPGAHVEYPMATTKDLGWNDVALTVLEGTLEFVITGRVPAGARDVTGWLSFQPCVGGACLPPRTVRWQAPAHGATSYSLLGALAGRVAKDPAPDRNNARDLVVLTP